MLIDMNFKVYTCCQSLSLPLNAWWISFLTSLLSMNLFVLMSGHMLYVSGSVLKLVIPHTIIICYLLSNSFTCQLCNLRKQIVLKRPNLGQKPVTKGVSTRNHWSGTTWEFGFISPKQNWCLFGISLWNCQQPKTKIGLQGFLFWFVGLVQIGIKLYLIRETFVCSLLFCVLHVHMLSNHTKYPFLLVEISKGVLAGRSKGLCWTVSPSLLPQSLGLISGSWHL